MVDNNQRTNFITQLYNELQRIIVATKGPAARDAMRSSLGQKAAQAEAAVLNTTQGDTGAYLREMHKVLVKYRTQAEQQEQAAAARQAAQPQQTQPQVAPAPAPGHPQQQQPAQQPPAPEPAPAQMTAAVYQATLTRLQPYAPHVKAWTTTILPLMIKGMPTTDPNHEKVQRMIRTGGQWEQMIAGQPAPEQLERAKRWFDRHWPMVKKHTDEARRRQQARNDKRREEAAMPSMREALAMLDEDSDALCSVLQRAMQVRGTHPCPPPLLLLPAPPPPPHSLPLSLTPAARLPRPRSRAAFWDGLRRSAVYAAVEALDGAGVAAHLPPAPRHPRARRPATLPDTRAAGQATAQSGRRNRSRRQSGARHCAAPVRGGGAAREGAGLGGGGRDGQPWPGPLPAARPPGTPPAVLPRRPARALGGGRRAWRGAVP